MYGESWLIGFGMARPYNVVYVRSQGTWLTPFTKRVLQQCISIAHDTSLQLSQRGMYDSTFPFETPAKLLQRLLNAIMSDRSGTKKSIAYFVGNQLFRCYFKVPTTPRSSPAWGVCPCRCVLWTGTDGR